MNTNGESKLERKLAATPAPAPPAGLAERIKREIPSELRFARPKRFPVNLRIAASILIVSLGGYVMFRVLPRTNEREPAAVPAERTIAAPPPRLQEEQKVAVSPKSEPPAAKEAPAVVSREAEAPTPAPPPETAGLTQQEPQPLAAQAEAQPASAPHAAAAGVAGALKTADVMELPARLNVEATVSPISGRTMLRVVAQNAPEANVSIEGAQKLAPGLYAIEGDHATIRLRYRRDGVERILDRTIGPADVRPWNAVSPEMQNAVRKAESPQ